MATIIVYDEEKPSSSRSPFLGAALLTAFAFTGCGNGNGDSQESGSGTTGGETQAVCGPACERISACSEDDDPAAVKQKCLKECVDLLEDSLLSESCRAALREYFECVAEATCAELDDPSFTCPSEWETLCV